MRRVACACAIATALSARTASAEVTRDPPPYEYTWFLRMLGGFGFVPNSSPFFGTTMEVGRHPFNGALSTAFSTSFIGDPFWEHWYAAICGVQLKLDLTYVFLTGLWAENIDDHRDFPFRLQIGSRIAMAFSNATALDPAYQLIRAELQSFVDVEVPLGRRHWAAFVLRGALDTPVGLDSVFRWNVQAGLAIDWGFR